jgi:hypothetical protein
MTTKNEKVERPFEKLNFGAKTRHFGSFGWVSAIKKTLQFQGFLHILNM